MNELEKMNAKQKRSTLLSIVCILSLIGGGFSIISYFFAVSMWNQIPEIMASNPLADQFGFSEMIESYFSPEKKPLFISILVLNVFSVIGVAMIWNLREIGLHFYVAAQIALLIAPMIWIQPFSFPFFDVLISAIFIYLYFREMKKVKQSIDVDNKTEV